MGKSSRRSAAQSKSHPAAGQRRGAAADASPPNVCLLSNGRYSVMLTEAGSGYSTHDGLDVTRWREDATGDCWGQYCYIRDLDGGRAWSAGRQPLGADADHYEASLGSDRAVFRRRDADIETRYEVAVVADADAEVRRITLTNHGARARTLQVTSYVEVALNDRRGDQAHPAFAKLFLQTEYLPAPPTLLCRRRPRARGQKPIWALHVLAGPEGDLRRRGRRGRVRDRPGQIPGPGPLRGSPRRSEFRSCPVGDRRVGPRSHSQPSPPRPARPGRIRRPCLRHRSGHRPRRGCGPRTPVQQPGRSRAHV